MSAHQEEIQKLLTIEKRSIQFLVLFLAASLWLRNGSVLVGLILGSGVAVLNFHWLWRIMEKVILNQKWIQSIQGLIRLVAIVFVIFIIIRFGKINPIAFVVGISTLFFGILFEVIYGAWKTEKKEKI